jgi:uncharacterized protein with HEPN domain
MPSESLRNALYDIRDNILLAQEFVAGLDYPAFTKSRLHVYAVTRALEIVSEASKRLPDEVRARHPRLPWRDIRDVGNFYRHMCGARCGNIFRPCSRQFWLKLISSTLRHDPPIRRADLPVGCTFARNSDERGKREARLLC